VAGRRLAAYVLDWLVSLIAGWLLVLAAAGILLAATGLDRHDPPNPALAAALIIVTAWLPGWLLYTAFAWSWRGATLGMAVAGIAVVSRAGGLASPWRACWRALLLAILSLPLLLSPLLAGAALALGSAGPLYLWLPVVALVALSAAACLSAFTTADQRAWHDRASGTRVVRAERRVGAMKVAAMEEQ
jgi:uncharacterized RDD family membrane protein YckC